MTENIFEIETAAITMRACYSEDAGISFTDFSDHRWIFMVLELQLFLLGFMLTPSLMSSMPARPKGSSR